MSESAIMRAVQIRACELGCRVFRNNVGLYKRGRNVIRYGLCVGSSDLIGWTPWGQFIAIEVKDGTETTKAQADFLKAVIQGGGIGMVVHGVDEFEEQYQGVI